MSHNLLIVTNLYLGDTESKAQYITNYVCEAKLGQMWLSCCNNNNNVIIRLCLLDSLFY